MKTDLKLLKEYLQSEIDCGNHKLFIFDENNNATELKTIDGFNAITDLEQEIERLNNIINTFEEDLENMKMNLRYSGVKWDKDCVIRAEIIKQVLDKLEELKESDDK